MPVLGLFRIDSTIDEFTMQDERCCGSGTCIINAEGYCWCGQKWNGQTMCFPQNSSTQDQPDDQVTDHQQGQS